MKKGIFKKSAFDILRDCLTPVIFTIVVTALVLAGLRKAGISSRAEGLRLLEESVMRAAVQCYAVEGVYPESVEYIEDHYGVYIDKARYAVHYEIFSSNVLPGITVMELNEDLPYENGPGQ